MNWEVMTVKSAALSFKPSGGWLKNLLRRYWLLPVAAFILDLCVCFLFSPMNLADGGSLAVHMQDLMRNQSTGQMFLNVGLGLAASLAVFSYLHSEPSVNSVHSMPVKRSHLFNASTLAGLLMVAVPLALNALVLLPFCGLSGIRDAAANISPDGLLTVRNVLAFGLVNILQATAVYIISNLAAILTGTFVSHALLAGLLNLLPWGLLQTVQSFLGFFFRGFPTDGMSIWNKLSRWSHPVFYYSLERIYTDTSTFSFTPAYYFIWIGILTLVTLLSAILYNKVKLEREKNVLVIPWTADLFVALAAFASASVAAVILAVNNIPSFRDAIDGKLARIPFILLFLPLTVVFFIFWRMLTERSTHVFRNGFWKKLLLSFLLPLAVFPFILFDVTGYQNRVPDPDQVTSVRVENYVFHDGVMDETGTNSPNYHSKEDLAKVRAFHEAAIEMSGMAGTAGTDHTVGTDYTDELGTTPFVPTTPVTIRYQLKNGKTLVRSYTVPTETAYATGKAMQELYETKTARVYNKLDKESLAGNTNMVLFAEGTQYSTGIRKEDWNGLMTAVNKDIMSRRYEDILTIGGTVPVYATGNAEQYANAANNTNAANAESSKMPTLAVADLVFLRTTPTEEERYAEDHMGPEAPSESNPLELRRFTLSTCDRNTIDFLISHGYATQAALRELVEQYYNVKPAEVFFPGMT